MKNVSVLRLVLSLAATAFVAMPALHAQENTITVQTFTYGSAPEGKFLFPSDTTRFEKILMHYKLRCPFDAQCGEWDYLMYIYLYDHTGRIDSTIDTSFSYAIGTSHPDSFPYMRSPSWRYFPRIQTTVTRTAVTSRDTALVGAGTLPLPAPFTGSGRLARSQYLWRKGELNGAGLKRGNVTGLRFNIVTPGTLLRNLTIRMKSTKRDTLGSGQLENDSLVTVYAADTRFTAAGWKTLDFPVPFFWNDSSNIIVDVSFENSGTGGTNTTVAGGESGFTSSLVSTSDDRSLHFEGRDYIEVPKGAFSSIDSAITIAFWAYGDPAYQPQDNSIIEAADAYGRRVLNIHLPWGDKNVYWDAGSLYGSYDRLVKAASPGEYEGRWNFWVFTKNVKAGTMKIYLNGALWSSGSSKRKPFAGIEQFKIGSFANGANNFDGNIDEFSVFNAEVDAATIRTWMGRDIDASHPFRSNLKLYYKFDSDGIATVSDASGNNHTGRLIGLPGGSRVTGPQIYRNFEAGGARPNVVFEQGVYTSRYDTVVAVDSIPTDPVQVVRYRNPADPATPTDTMTVWPASYRYTFNNRGEVTDSVRTAPDSVLRLAKAPYFRKFEIVNRYEIGRYITPYGNGLSLGEGFDWVFDVSDYRTLLHDSVHLSAFNQQELVDLSFEMVKGTPPRDPISVQNLWNGGFPYGTSTSIENYLKPLKVKIPENAENTRIKIRPTGHGFGGTENCAEFCPKDHSILVNGAERYKRTVWRDDCGLNPVYPQGGTWVYDRTNWCPGAEVWTYDFELTPWVTKGDSVTLDYNVESYTWNGQGSQPYYQVETQLISYGAPNFTLDASLEQIKAPSKTDLFRRMNPICSRPIVTIRNTGSTPLTSLKITYGISGLGVTPSVYRWTGHLDFMESVDVELGQFAWAEGSTLFYAEVSEPNGGADQYPNNNVKESTAEFPPQYPSQVVFELKTNNYGSETSYQIKDASGNVFFEKSGLDDATTYRDTLTLPDGCYEFRLKDEGKDGLQWWANQAAGAGTMRIRRTNGGTLKTFNPDFGTELYQQFTVGTYLAGAPVAGDEVEETMEVYPNPTKGEFTIDLRLGRSSDVTVSVRDLLGNQVYRRQILHTSSESLTVDLSDVPPGVYVVSARTAIGVISRKVVVE